MSSWRSASIAATVCCRARRRGQPRGVPFPPPTPEPRDVPYAGVITLDVDASDVTRGIFRVRERVPVARPGPLTLLYPRVAPRQARAARRDQSAVGHRDPRERRAARVAPRSRQRVRVPRRRAGRRRRARPHVPVRVADADEPRPHRRHARDAESAVGGGAAVSGGSLRVAIRVVPTLKLPAGWSFAVALDGAEHGGRHDAFRRDGLGDARRLAAVRGQALPARRSRSRAPRGRCV